MIAYSFGSIFSWALVLVVFTSCFDVRLFQFSGKVGNGGGANEEEKL